MQNYRPRACWSEWVRWRTRVNHVSASCAAYGLRLESEDDFEKDSPRSEGEKGERYPVTLSSSLKGGRSPGEPTVPLIFEGPCCESRAGQRRVRVPPARVTHRHSWNASSHIPRYRIDCLQKVQFLLPDSSWWVSSLWLWERGFLFYGLGAVDIDSFLSSRQEFREITNYKICKDFK